MVCYYYKYAIFYTFLSVVLLGAPAYIGEMSPPSIRGLLISLKEAAIVVGILMGYLVGYLMSSTDGGWAYTFGVSAIPASIMFFGAWTLHESARWLYLNNRHEEAKAALAWILPPHIAESTFADLGNTSLSTSIL